MEVNDKVSYTRRFKMKKTGSFFIGLSLMVVMIFSISACGDNAKPTSYYINGDGNLIVVLDDGNENNLGSWGEDIISSFDNITISDDGYYVIDGIKTNITLDDSFVKGLSSIEISDDGFYIVNGMKTDICAIKVFTVSFDTGYSTNVQAQKVKDGYKVERPELTRTGYTLNGWYCNGEEWRFNSDVVKNDMTLNAKWTAKSYTINFDEDGGEEVDNLSVTYDDNYLLP
ncbi:MAG: InlB B-repeat-containing protein, partial [Mollicutes bacterium]|nr:InlB B-repeat-containing protein [Mollicutes bacterium]